MATTRHRPPSRERYAAKHPALTVHLDLDLYAKIVELRERSGLTLNQLVRQALGSVEDHVETIRGAAHVRGFDLGNKLGYDVGYETGYAAAKDEYGLTIECSECDEPIEILAGAPIAERAVELLRERGWGHKACVEKGPREATPPPLPLSGPRGWAAVRERDAGRAAPIPGPRS
jgi:Ribbon-helix-helix protein, copG family